MKALILILVSMVILSGCEPTIGPVFSKSGDDDSSNDSNTYWYSAIVDVRMENGDPCTESYVYLIENSKTYYSSLSGTVMVRVMLSFVNDDPPLYKDYLCNIYMDQNDPPVLIEREISLKYSRNMPTYTVVFPDSLSRNMP